MNSNQNGISGVSPYTGQSDNAACGSVIVNYTTDVATTRLLVPEDRRKPGLVISYKDPAIGWVNEQFTGLTVDDTSWMYDLNWQYASLILQNVDRNEIFEIGTMGGDKEDVYWETRDLLTVVDFSRYPDGYMGDIGDLSGNNHPVTVTGLASYASGRNGIIGGKFMIESHRTSGMGSEIRFMVPEDSDPVTDITIEVYGHLRRPYNQYKPDGVLDLMIGDLNIDGGVVTHTMDIENYRYHINQEKVFMAGPLSDPFIKDLLSSPIKIDGVDDGEITTGCNHLAMVLNEKRFAVFLDGQKILEANINKKLDFRSKTVKLFANTLKCDVKSVRIYKTALTDNEILTNYNGTITFYH